MTALAHVAAPLTTAARVLIGQLFNRGVHVAFNVGAVCGRTVPVTTISGDTYACREALKLHGFRYSPRSRRWTTTGALDLEALLAQLVAQYDAHEDEAQRPRRFEMTRARSLDLVATISRLPAPAAVPDAERITSAVSEMVAQAERAEATTVAPPSRRAS